MHRRGGSRARSFLESFRCLGGTAAAEDRPIVEQQCQQENSAAVQPHEADPPKSPLVCFLPVSTPLLSFKVFRHNERYFTLLVRIHYLALTAA